ncbi:MAG: ABC transporter permease [Eubacteriales bacterium]|nr:ABC transporter permease [Eubacteriales bacterium]
MVRQGRAAAKLAWRAALENKGRYIAILLIVFLSVGFFSGLKVTKAGMWDAAERYFKAQNLYDYRVFSSYGFTKDEIKGLSKLDEIKAAEGMYSCDVRMSVNGDTENYLCLSIPEKVNRPSLTAGRMPKNKKECLADHRAFSEKDIGKTVTVASEASENSEAGVSGLTGTKYRIVGLVNSPIYISSDRGASTSSSGERKGFLYFEKSNFTSPYYTEADLTLRNSYKSGEASEIYSKAYDRAVSRREKNVKESASKLVKERMASIAAPPSAAAFSEPEIQILTRNENSGYVSFKNDTSIIHSISDIFPLFFILIALLVCITTMLRMVEEERGEIGTLKAMGYSNDGILLKYFLYAGSAAVLGWAGGFFFGTYFLPKGFWLAYGSLYDFIGLRYIFDPIIAIGTLSVSLAAFLISTGCAVRAVLSEMPASLIRPKAAKAGKRILLERITPVWSRLSFLGKAVFRNIFRYKIRMIMMLFGVGCSAALILTAFGVRDSMVDVGSLQFDKIQKYQLEVSIDTSASGNLTNGVSAGSADSASGSLSADKIAEEAGASEASIQKIVPVRKTYADIESKHSQMGTVGVYGFSEDANLSGFWNFKSTADGKTLAVPEGGKALLSKRLSAMLKLSSGDSFTVREERKKTLKEKASYVNYVGNAVIVNEKTYEDIFGKGSVNTLLIKTKTLSVKEEKQLCARLMKIDGVTSVTRLSEQRAAVDGSLSCLNGIIWLLVLFAGALSFIVIFNLTNINIAERSREIATVEVLGFYPKETRFYVLRENIVLSVIAGILGLPVGYLGTYSVVTRILLDSLTFRIRVTVWDYLLTLVCTIVFALIVNRFMRRQVRKIRMAESLKTVE